MFSRIRWAPATSTSTDTNRAAAESAFSTPARTSSRPTSTATVPAMSLAKCMALAFSAALPWRRAARNSVTVRSRSTASTMTAMPMTHHVASTCPPPSAIR